MTMFATIGCFSTTILMQSAQLEKNAIALDVAVHVSPSPPMTLGNSASPRCLHSSWEDSSVG